MNLIYNFDLPIILNRKFVVPDIIDKYKIEVYQKETILDVDTIDFFSNIELPIREVQLFLASSMYCGTIHIDGHNTNYQMGCVNYVVNNDLKWRMQWFELKQSIELIKKTSLANTDYMPFNSVDCDLIESVVFEKSALINISIPHRIINISQRPRHCLSLRFIDNNFYSILNKLNGITTNI